MKKSDEFKDFIVVLYEVGIALIFIALLMYPGPPPEPAQTFKVVNEYNGCDVVRYTDPSNRYHYFIDCQ